MKKKLFLIDAFAVIFRAHFAFITRPLMNSKGQNVSAITGFLNSMRELIAKEGATHIAVCFDLPGGTFRNEMFSDYKANREETPEGIIFATPWIKHILKAMNIPIYSMAGYEADDVAGAIAKQADELGFFDEIYLFTPDKDYGQLVTETVKMMKPARSGNEIEVLGIKEVCEVWGIQRVEQVIDCLGLQGDAVDNIPGVPGIGPKTAQKLLEEFGSIENLLQNTDKLKGKNKESLEKFAEQAILSKKLATIDVNVPVVFNADDCELGDFNYDELDQLFQELEFRTLAKWADEYKRKRAAKEFKDGLSDPQSNGAQKASSKSNTNPNQFDLFGGTNDALPELDRNIHANNNITNTTHIYKCVSKPEEIAELVALLADAKIFCFDTETTGLDANDAELVGMSFAVKTGEAYYVPVPANQAETKKIVEQFKLVFENENIAKIGQNLKYDMLLLRWYGVEVKGELWDTMLMHYLLEPELKHNMNYLAETYLKYAPIKIETLIGEKGVKQRTMRSVPVEKVVDYAAEDADITLQLYEYLQPKLKESGDLLKLYTEIEAPLIQVLTDIEFEGVNVNAEFLQNYSKVLEVDILDYRSKIYEVAGVEFNVDSPKQVGEILFDRMKIPYKGKKTKLGAYSTDEEKLSELAEEYPVAQRILDYRSLQKLRSTYVDALPKQINSKTNRVHTSYNQFLASTGRLSSNNPNLQNIPIKTIQGREIRKAFVARNDDYTVLSADYSQVELRLIAEISKDANMLEAFRLNQDIHQATAAKVYDTPLDEVTSEQRRNAKTVNFSIVYGAGARNVGLQLGISNKEAKELIANYFKTYSGLQDYMKNVVAEAREKGYVTTLVGRRRRLRDIHSQSAITRAAAERTAVNSPVQGSAADLIKIAMINIYKILKDRQFRSKMILQVHDELVFDVHKDELEELRQIVSDCMRNALPNLSVPLEVGIGTGANWLDAH